jgi:hypothetical protein
LILRAWQMWSKAYFSSMLPKCRNSLTESWQ